MPVTRRPHSTRNQNRDFLGQLVNRPCPFPPARGGSDDNPDAPTSGFVRLHQQPAGLVPRKSHVSCRLNLSDEKPLRFATSKARRREDREHGDQSDYNGRLDQ